MSDAAIPNVLAVLALGIVVLWTRARFQRGGAMPAVWWQILLVAMVALLGLGVSSAAGKIAVVKFALIAMVLGPTKASDPRVTTVLSDTSSDCGHEADEPGPVSCGVACDSGIEQRRFG